jgi:hypothetical protein
MVDYYFDKDLDDKDSIDEKYNIVKGFRSYVLYKE